MITMTKAEAETKLNKQLTNNEYMQYIHMLNFGSKKQTHKNAQTKTAKTNKAPLKFNDAKAEFLQVNNFDTKSFKAKYYEYFLKFDDCFLGFTKPSIKTRFCFGYGLNGVSSQEDYEGAREQEKNMETNQQAFINANLEELNESIKDLQDFIDNFFDHKNTCFSSRYNKIFICKNSYNHLAYLAWSWDYDNIRNKDAIIKEANKEDLLLIIEVYKQQIENFKKRLNTYLKRYGLSKLTTWTYLVD